jgi:DsbC/DsbD-like thiol-disulfide interchange protein
MATAALAQSSTQYVTLGDVAKATGKRGAAVQVKIPVTVKEGYHVNSNKPTESYLIPLALTWTSTGALEGGTVTYPKPLMEAFEFSEPPGSKLSVYMGSVDLVANFKVAANAAAGPGIATGKLKYQACSNKACYPPKTIDVNVSYSVQ